MKKLFFLSLLSLLLGFLFLLIITLKVELPTKKNALIFYQNRRMKEPLIKAINNAKTSIFLSIFSLTDKEILKALKKASERGVQLKIFFDKKHSFKQPQKYLNKKYLLPIKKSGLMHQKVIVIDNILTFVGSANLTKLSLKMHSNLFVGIYKKKIASFLENKSSSNLVTTVGSQSMEIIILPEEKALAMNRVEKIIDSAASSIDIAMYTFSNKKIANRLIAAKKRGVDITVVIDSRTASSASKNLIELLKKEDIDIRISKNIELLHHKYLYVDKKLLLFGSCNFTKAAFSKNSEIVIIIHKLSKRERRFMGKTIKTIKTEATPFLAI